MLVLVTGFAAADPGVNQLFETQGITLVTSIQATGNLYSESHVTMSVGGNGIITQGDDPILAGYPYWNNFPCGGYQQFLVLWAMNQDRFPGITLQDMSAYLERDSPGSWQDLFFKDLLNWAGQQPAGGLEGNQLYEGEVRYTSTYSEETQSNGRGYITYDKDLNIETKAALNGQSNIEATKEIAFEGINGAEITSTDNIFLSGTGEDQPTSANTICVFAAATSSNIPRFCNSVEAGSSFTMEVVNARTETNSRFVTDSADTPVEVNHNIRVDSLGNRPSEGKVSAFMEGSILEARDTPVVIHVDPITGQFISLSGAGESAPFEELTFREDTRVDGEVTLFDKDMAWESGIRRT
jgi:hypothetical protein